jgi:hypothetical protein
MFVRAIGMTSCFNYHLITGELRVRARRGWCKRRAALVRSVPSRDVHPRRGRGDVRDVRRGVVRGGSRRGGVRGMRRRILLHRRYVYFWLFLVIFGYFWLFFGYFW